MIRFLVCLLCSSALAQDTLPVSNLHTQISLVPVTNVFILNDTNAIYGGNAFARISPPMPPIPALPERTVTRATNEQGQKVTVIVETAVQPSPLIQDKPKTNAFWVMCPYCSVRAIRTPKRVEIIGTKSVPDGIVIERAVYFRCCQQEFPAKTFKFVETPVAEEVTVPKK